MRSAGWTWPSAWSAILRCCSWTSRLRGLTRRPAGHVGADRRAAPGGKDGVPDHPLHGGSPAPRGPDRDLAGGAIAAQGTAEQLSRALGHATRISFLAPPQIGPAQVSAAVGTPVEQDGRWLGFRSDQAQRDLTALLGWAAEHGVELTDIRVSPPTLDDVFVQLAVPAGEAQDDGS